MTPAARPVDVDTVLYAARAMAARWLRDSPLDAFSGDSLPASISVAAASVIHRTAEVMASAARRVGGPCSTDADRIELWLAGCVDALAEPDSLTRPDRVIRPFGSASAGANAPLRRSNAGLRESTQAMGVRWIRGRSDGSCQFGVGQLGGRCTVFEHGVPDDDAQLQRRLIGAAAMAVVRRSKAMGRQPLSVDRTASALLEQANEYCASPEAQLPAFLASMESPDG